MNTDITFIKPYTEDKEYWTNTVVNEKNKLFGTEVKIPNTSLLLYTGIINLSKSNIHTIHTPIKLVSEIMSYFPIDYDFKSKQYGILYTFEWALYLKYVLGVPSENITVFGDGEERFRLSMYEGFNYSDANKLLSDELFVIMKRHEKENNKILHMKQDITKKFDVVVGNPPYQKNNNDAKRWTLWELFVKKSFDIGSIVALVIPQSITGPSSFGLIKNCCHILNVNVSKYFNVGSTFCYFVASPGIKVNKTKIITSAEEFNLDISNYPFLPFVIDSNTIAQITDLMSRKKRVWKRGELHTSKKALFSENGRYSVTHTNAQELFTDEEHPNKNKIRVVVSLSGYPKFKVVHNGYASQACFWTEFSTLNEAQKFADECNGQKVQDILKTFKWSGWNSKEVIQCL